MCGIYGMWLWARISPGMPDRQHYSRPCAPYLELEKYGIVVSDILASYVNTPFLDVEEEVYSIRKMGIKIEPATVAHTVWKAAHGKKLHWKIGLPTYVLSAIFWLLPVVRRTIVRKLAIAPA